MADIHRLDTATPTLAEALEVVERLRADLIHGRLIGFYAVGLTAADKIFGYTGATRPVSRLRMIGALALASHDYHHDSDSHAVY